MSESPKPKAIDWSLTTWEGSRRAQLDGWASMSLDHILEAQEEMAELSADLARQAANPLAETQRHASQVVREQRIGFHQSAYDLPLLGCTPEPLMAYLKALGILRLVGEQKDPDARGWWRNDVFWVRSQVLFRDATNDQDQRAAVTEFLLTKYAPTPIVAPWAGGSGFFRKDNKQAANALSDSKSVRVQSYRRVIQQVRAVVHDEKIRDKPLDEEKVRLLRRYRRELPDDLVTWMDAAMVLHLDGQRFAPLLGTGGNDGRLDFTQNFMQRVVLVGLHSNQTAGEKSRAWLQHALFGAPARMDKASVGQFTPGRGGGPNATQGMEGEATDNPWDFILMIEGVLLLAGAATRRFGTLQSPRAGFPFSVHAVGAAFDSAGSKDEDESRGELWLPIWSKPTSKRSLQHLFGEGRAEVSGRRAQTGVDFARAVAALGVDRGIAEFRRIGFLRRSGKAFLATPLGRFEVVARPAAHLLCEVDPWVDQFRAAAKEAPPRFVSALRAIDSAVFDFCKYGGAPAFQEIIVAVGRAERELARMSGKVGNRTINPLGGLSENWIEAADDRSSEFAIARALASVDDLERRMGPLRANLEAVDVRRGKFGESYVGWAEKGRAVVWNAADLATNLRGALQRRLMDGARLGCRHLPLVSSFTVSLSTVAAFIAGELDDERIGELIWGLMLVPNQRYQAQSESEPDNWSIPRAYALLKLLFLPRPLVTERSKTGRLIARLLRDGESGGIAIRPEPVILHLLQSGRLGEACAIAMRRLRASGLAPIPRRIRGRRLRDEEWRELDNVGTSAMDPRRLAAALLIPLTDHALSAIVRLVISSDEVEDHRTQPISALHLEGDLLS